MWLFRQSHKHIDQETLSEYLDGRLQGRDLERVEQRLGECDACRLELEELQATVAMMRLLPMETPRRSFVMDAPPLESPRAEEARSRPILVLRAPNWVYAGAASVAALALAVTISVDATGGLSSDPLRRDVAETAVAPASDPEQVTVTSGAGFESSSGTGVEGTAPPPVAAAGAAGGTGDATSQGEAAPGSERALSTAEPSEATSAPVVAPTPVGTPAPVAAPTPAGTPAPTTAPASGATPTIVAPLPTPSPVARQGAGAGGGPPSFEATPLPTTAPAPAAGPVATVIPAPTAQDSGAIAIDPARDGPASTTAVPEDGGARGPRSTTGAGGTSLLESQATKVLTLEEPTPVSGTAESVLLSLTEGDTDRDTSVWWRVLEVVAGVVAVGFLAGLVLRRRANRRDLA